MNENILEITRERYVIVRNNRTEIFCGTNRNFEFREIDKIGNVQIRTYQSYNMAKTSFEKSWNNINFDYEIVKVKDTILEVKQDVEN